MKPSWPMLLASQSPRRRELLETLGFQLTMLTPAVDETPSPGEIPEVLVLRLAWSKARAVAAQATGLVLAADTTVAVAGRLLGKPANREELREMLLLLSGETHEVWTGVALTVQSASSFRAELAAARSLVRFRQLSHREIDDYVATGEGLDKAGGYAIQGQASRFVAELKGSLSNVIGLPLSVVVHLYGRLTGEHLPRPERPVWLRTPQP